MIHLLLAVIYLSFISLGLPDSLLGSAWPTIYQEFQVPVSYASAFWYDRRLYESGTVSVLFIFDFDSYVFHAWTSLEKSGKADVNKRIAG